MDSLYITGHSQVIAVIEDESRAIPNGQRAGYGTLSIDRHREISGNHYIFTHIFAYLRVIHTIAKNDIIGVGGRCEQEKCC
jgi:hypothetical protein